MHKPSMAPEPSAGLSSCAPCAMIRPVPDPPDIAILAPFAGTVVSVVAASEASLPKDAVVVLLEAMKMEHEVLTPAAGSVREVAVSVGDSVQTGDVLMLLAPLPAATAEEGPPARDATNAPQQRPGAEAGGANPTQPRAPRAANPHKTATAEDGEAAGRQREGGPAEPPKTATPADGQTAGRPSEGGPAEPPSADLAAGSPRADPKPPRADLQQALARHAQGLDAARPEEVARRHEKGRRTARENLAGLIDAGTWVEYGPLLFAAQERRRPREELQRRTPADGLVAGVGEIEGRRCVALSYDYTVLAGTQGMRNHRKKDRLFAVAEKERLPVVLFAEGGGGRPGDVDWPMVAGLDCKAFALFAKLSGLVPLVGIASGYCFAGNAALLGCCDVVIASEDASIGMGGPAMIEGGGLGVFAPGEVGPIEMQYGNGVVDIRVQDDAQAVAATRRYLSYFGGSRPGETVRVPDQTLLRTMVPQARKRAYDVHRIIETLCDEGTVLELRGGFAPGIVTALARVNGNPLGIVANDSRHLGGAIDAPGADKAARFTTLCDTFGIPLLYLCDTPGFMVGPDAEQTATVRHCARMFLAGANVSVPTGTIVLRKGYGLGAQAMAGGGFAEPLFTVSWPTGEFGGMGLEGAVRLGMRRELEAIADPTERARVFDATVKAAYEHGEALNMAAYGEIDDVIDPADSRRWIALLFRDPQTPTTTPRRFVDAW
jgi:acetyl-CoA carboxylase carboxyltransferase component